MDATTYKNTIEWKTDLELRFLFARQNDIILCSCGKMIIKNTIHKHWKSQQHRIDLDILLCPSK